MVLAFVSSFSTWWYWREAVWKTIRTLIQLSEVNWLLPVFLLPSVFANSMIVVSDLAIYKRYWT